MIYVIRGKGQREIKVGFTKDAKTLTTRLSTLQTGHPFPLEVVTTFRGTISDERLLHQFLEPFHSSGEWFLWQDFFAELFADCRLGVPQAIHDQSPRAKRISETMFDECEVSETKVTGFFRCPSGLIVSARILKIGPDFSVKSRGDGRTTRVYRVGDVRLWLLAWGVPYSIDRGHVRSLEIDGRPLFSGEVPVQATLEDLKSEENQQKLLRRCEEAHRKADEARARALEVLREIAEQRIEEVER
ncbi:MAG: GIY-YIG nuclease family protein [Elusimicrobiota bacterium]|jgi:hypothetical protein